MNNRRPIRSIAQHLILATTLVIVGLGLIGWYGSQAYHAYAHLRYPAPSTDVAAIRGWMTVPYIARAYRVPEDALFAALGIPRAGNERLSLTRLSRKYGREPLATRQAIQQALPHNHGGAPPLPGGALWRR